MPARLSRLAAEAPKQFRSFAAAAAASSRGAPPLRGGVPLQPSRLDHLHARSQSLLRAGAASAQVCSQRSLAAAATARGAPPGYWGPRIAVFGATTAGAVALYELISRWLLGTSDGDGVADDLEWDAAWDDAEFLVPRKGTPGTPEEAVLAAALRIRGAHPDSARAGRRSVVFVRHARPSDLRGDAGVAHPPLADDGKKQAQLTGERLLKILGEAEVRAIYHSGAPEAKATGEVIEACLKTGRHRCELIESALLKEGIPVLPSPAPQGFIESISGDEAELALDATRAEGAFRAHVWRPTGEEPSRASADVVVGHGNMLRYIACRALQLPPTAWSRLRAHHCAVTWLDVDSDGSVSLREFGGVGHLPPELVTYH